MAFENIKIKILDVINHTWELIFSQRNNRGKPHFAAFPCLHSLSVFARQVQAGPALLEFKCTRIELIVLTLVGNEGLVVAPFDDVTVFKYHDRLTVLHR